MDRNVNWWLILLFSMWFNGTTISVLFEFYNIYVSLSIGIGSSMEVIFEI